MITENTGLVLQCDEAGTIISVLFANLSTLPVTNWAGVSLFSLIDAASEETTLFLLESVKQFGHAEAWPINFKAGDEVLHFYCNAASFSNSIMLMIYESAGNIISLDRSSVNASPEITAEPVAEIPGQTESDLLEELSRLNNELINTKRELIRQNVTLKRLQNPWEEGLTFI